VVKWSKMSALERASVLLGKCVQDVHRVLVPEMGPSFVVHMCDDRVVVLPDRLGSDGTVERRGPDANTVLREARLSTQNDLGRLFRNLRSAAKPVAECGCTGA
jgi:hypothetical protein